MKLGASEVGDSDAKSSGKVSTETECDFIRKAQRIHCIIMESIIMVSIINAR